MKQKLYILGLISVMIIFAGSVFKVNHLPGAGILITLGMTCLILFFLPLALRNHYQSGDNKQFMALYIVTYITCFVLFTAMLFKIQHWPFAGLALTIALPFPYVIFLPFFLNSTSKIPNFSIYNTVSVLLLLAVISVCSALLGLNVSRDKIVESYNLSKNSNRIEMILEKIPSGNRNLPVISTLDAALKTVETYQKAIFDYELMSRETWENDPKSLVRPDSRFIAFEALKVAGEDPQCSKLINQLSEVIKGLETTPGYKAFSENLSEILLMSTKDNPGYIPLIDLTKDNLSWVLINLDALRANLLLIKTVTSASGF